METLLLDLRYAWRLVRRNAGLSLAAVLSLALGIGANAAVFTFVKALLLPPLQVHEPERLAALFTRDSQTPGLFPVSYLNYRDYRARNQVFSDVLAHLPIPVTLGRAEAAERAVGEIVSGNYFDLLGVRPVLGRSFLPEEDLTPGSHPVAVISESLWRRRFGAAPSAIGAELVIDGTTFTVVGVAPGSFDGLTVGLSPDVWVPLMMHAQVLSSFSEHVHQRRGLTFGVVGRLRPGAELEQARAHLQGLSAELQQEYPEANRGRSLAVLPLASARLDPNERGGIVAASGLLLGVVAFVLLIACVNLANALLARALERRREIAVRMALGAGRRRLLRQLLTESLILALAGGLLGLVLSTWATRALWALRPAGPLTISLDLQPDLRVLGFTLLVALATGVLFGLAPALQATRADVLPALKDALPATGGGRRLALRQLVLVGQVAASLLLLAAAALFARSMQHATRIDAGFEARGLLAVSLDTGLYGYGDAKARVLFRELEARLGTLPGVTGVGLAQYAPLGGAQMRTLSFEGQSQADARGGSLLLTNAVSPGFLAAAGIPLLRGRGIEPGDAPGQPAVAVINATAAARYWPGADPLGREFRLGGAQTPVRVVGVARDSKYASLGEDARPHAYLALAQTSVPGVQLLVRTSGGTTLTTVRDAVQALDPGLPLFDAGPLSARLERALWLPRVGSALLGFFGLLGLVLTSVGLYGVAAHEVKRRTREVGIRLALGCARSQALGLLLRRGLALVAAGLALGLAASVALAPLVSGLVYGTREADWLPLLGALATLLVVAVAATGAPAWRLARLEPVRALRQE